MDPNPEKVTYARLTYHIKKKSVVGQETGIILMDEGETSRVGGHPNEDRVSEMKYIYKINLKAFIRIVLFVNCTGIVHTIQTYITTRLCSQ